MARTRKISERYALAASPLFRLSTQRKLATLLKASKPALEKLVRATEYEVARCYKIEDRQVGRKLRTIECPIGKMRAVHERIKRLLGRIHLPAYLMSPRQGRTILSNAAVHRDATQVVKMDVRSFYPSTSRELVFRLFHHTFEMPADVAGMLAKLLTVHGHVPTGSPASPIVAFWAARRAFDGVDDLASNANLHHSLWVDDIAISGAQVERSVVVNMRKRLEKLGYRTHKVHLQSKKHGFNVTGIRINSRGQNPTNETNLKIRNGLTKLHRKRGTHDDNAKLLSQLIGVNGHRLAILPIGHPARIRALGLHQHLVTRRRALNKRPTS